MVPGGSLEGFVVLREGGGHRGCPQWGPPVGARSGLSLEARGMALGGSPGGFGALQGRWAIMVGSRGGFRTPQVLGEVPTAAPASPQSRSGCCCG